MKRIFTFSIKVPNLKVEYNDSGCLCISNDYNQQISIDREQIEDLKCVLEFLYKIKNGAE